MAKIDYSKLNEVVKTVTTQERIKGDATMPPIDRSEFNMITPGTATPKATPSPAAAPAAAPVATVTPAPQIIEAVKQPEASATSTGTPSVSSDGKQAEQTSANASTDEEAEIKEDELPEGIRKRFSKLTNQKKEALARAKELEEKEKAMQALLDAKEKELSFYKEIAMAPKPASTGTVTPTPEPAVQPVAEKEPEFDDFKDNDNPISAFVKAHSSWAIRQAIAPITKQINPAVIEAKRRVAAEVAENADFTQVVNMENPAIKMLSENPITNAMIPASHDNLKISYYLGKNPAEAKRIASLTDPIDIAIELREIQKKIKPQSQTQTGVPPVTPAPVVVTPAVVVSEKPVTKTNAPVPFKPVNSNGTAPLPDVSTLTPEQMMDDPRYAFLKKRRY
jgi:hypothetical protein